MTQSENLDAKKTSEMSNTESHESEWKRSFRKFQVLSKESFTGALEKKKIVQKRFSC